MEVAIEEYQPHGSICFRRPWPDTYQCRHLEGLVQPSYVIDGWHTDASYAMQLSGITGISTHTSSLPHFCQYVYFVWHAQPPVSQCVLHYFELALIEQWTRDKVDKGAQVSLAQKLENNEKTCCLQHVSRRLWRAAHTSPVCFVIAPWLIVHGQNP